MAVSFTSSFATAWADFSAPGVPNNPPKALIRQIGVDIDASAPFQAIQESSQPPNSKWDMYIEASDSYVDAGVPGTIRDNIMALRNASQRVQAGSGGQTHLRGNCALRFLWPDRYDGMAFGISAPPLGKDRTNTGAASVYTPNTTYWSASDLSGGTNDFGVPQHAIVVEVIAGCTLNGAPHPFAGVIPYWMCFQHIGNTGQTFLRARSVTPGLPGVIGLDGNLDIGTNLPVQASMTMKTTRVRLRERNSDDFFAITTNADLTGTKDNAAKASWQVKFGNGIGEDQFAVGSSAVGQTAFTDHFTVTRGLIKAQIPNASLAKVAASPASGSTYSIAATTEYQIVKGAGTIATLTVALPPVAASQDGQIVTVSFAVAVTTLTVNGSGVTVAGAPTTAAANDKFSWIYHHADATWYRI